MAEVLVTGKKISDMVLVSDIVGTEKIPTDVAGDKAVTTGQLLTYLDNNGRSGWGRIDGDIGLQTDLMNKFNQQDLELANHAGNTQNPHNVTKEQVGLANVDNTTDLDKPISTATQAAIDGVSTSLSNHTGNHLNPHNVTKTQVGLGNVDDTSDVNKPVSIATQNSLNLKVNVTDFDEHKDFLKRGNRYKFDSNLSPYSKGQIVQSDNELVEFLSLVDNNTINPNTTPFSGSWKVYTGEGSVPEATSTVSGTTKLVDNLLSTDTSSALTAKQGKVLDEKKLNAVDSMVFSTYINLTSSRLNNTTYTNDTGKPIQLLICANFDNGSITLGGVTMEILDNTSYATVCPIVPAGMTYRINATSIVSWLELR